MEPGGGEKGGEREGEGGRGREKGMTGAGLICILTSEKSPVMDDVTDFPSQGEKHDQSFAWRMR